MIKEIIVVEGRDDVTAVKAAVDAEVIAVSGFGINKNTIDKIKEAQIYSEVMGSDHCPVGLEIKI